MLKRVSVIVLAVVICATFIAFIGCDKAKRSSPNTPKGPEGVKAMMQQGGMTAAGQAPSAPAKDAEEAPAEQAPAEGE
ncbi:MAG: hypothetical protein KBA64_14905 [Armatimonadetes bacterium]|jgi:hypothetical protein|nr:hypothetical protein [Armatimonadota bacterium]